MDSRRRAELLVRLGARISDEGGPTINSVCALAADVTGVTGAGITLIGAQGDQLGAGASDETSARIESLQFTLGEGPCIDAHRSGHPVLAEDLADPGEVRWPVWRHEAIQADVAATFAYPLIIGSARLGALDLYRDRPGPLSVDEDADATIMADIAIRSVLAVQAAAPPGLLAPQLDASSRYVVHRAAGMLSVQLDIPVDDALDRIRAHGFTHSQPIETVAADITNHILYIVD